jgi:hypothetical protein
MTALGQVVPQDRAGLCPTVADWVSPVSAPGQAAPCAPGNPTPDVPTPIVLNRRCKDRLDEKPTRAGL